MQYNARKVLCIGIYYSFCKDFQFRFELGSKITLTIICRICSRFRKCFHCGIIFHIICINDASEDIYQRIARLSSKSRSRQLLSILDQSRSRQPLNFPVSMSLGLDNLKIFKSQLVSFSTTLEKLSIGKSRSRQLPYKNNDNLPLKPIARQGYQGTTIR